MKKKELLEIIAEERIHGELENTLKNNDQYIAAQTDHDNACDNLEEMEIDKNLSKVIDRVLSTANNCGAVYGAIAYRQGLYDGIELVAEIK